MFTLIKKPIIKSVAKTALISLVFAFIAVHSLSQGQIASASLCDELSQSSGSFFSCGDEAATTFTQFQGGLQQPSVDGYDPTLTQETNLRDYIINIVNFVLGFLGLLAVIVVIYGGFRYVTAAGNDEATQKGKKSIMYAIIGIMIVMVSFALVNTVIKGIGKGTDQGAGAGLSGSAPGVIQEDQQKALQRLFFSAATEIERASKDLASAYAHYVDVMDAIAELRNVPQFSTPEQAYMYLNGTKQALRNIISTSGDLSYTTEQAKIAEDFVDHFLRATDEEMDQYLEDDSGWLDMFGGGASAITDDIGGSGGDVYERSRTDVASDFWDPRNQKVDRFQDLINGMTDGLEVQALRDFNVKADRVQVAIDDIMEVLETSGFFVSEGTELGNAYDDVVDSLLEDNLIPDNQSIIITLESLNTFHSVVQNIQFVAAVLAVDVDEGNAPLIINFDALKSLRPDYQSISAEDIVWDFGDGTTAEGRFATSHVYRKTGSYIASLSIAGDSEVNIATGKAYKDIIIRPPASQINLKVAVGQRDLGYMSYYKDGFLTIDKNRLNVTLTEARDTGITFDSSESIGGYQAEQSQEAGETYIQTITWDFGDNSDTIMGEMVAEDVQTHYYGDEGTYPVILEVTDSRGIKDRKVFEVVVDSPAARINVTPGTKTLINQDINFEGGQSASDGGQIVGYKWDLLNPQTNFESEKDTESFTENFTAPGVYRISLTVTDNMGSSATDDTQVVIESEPPQASFTYKIQDDRKPHIFLFDGSKSFDPDGDTTSGDYTFKWKVTASNDAYDFVDEDGELLEDAELLQKTYIKFYETGLFDVTLHIDDPNEPENPGIPETYNVDVNSILDIAYGNLEQGAAILDENGQAAITLEGLSENGSAYEWDFGDDSELVTGDIRQGDIETTHTYREAGTYDVRLTVFDNENNENSLKRRIVIGEADSPIAVAALKVNGNEIFDLSQPIKVNRKSIIEFNAERSLNRDGTGRRLGYQWDFGDTQKSTQKTITHTYSDLSPTTQGYYSATLKVVDKNDLTKSSTAEVLIDVIGELPTMQAFTAVPQQTDLITPVRIKLDAIGAQDPDGRVVKYLWWYYNELDPQMTMGHTVTQSEQAFLNIGTRGREGEAVTYKFGLKMTDQENFSIEADEILSANLIPSIDVVNGPNDLPVSQFNVDRTSVMVGESVNFTSSSTDPDGRIVQYVWDVEGDGFGNNKPTDKSTFVHTYEKPSVDGVNARLKVIDDNFAESVSMPVRIYVDTDAQKPVSAFKSKQGEGLFVNFTNNSKADEDAGAELISYKWDFDVSSTLDSADSDGDGKKDNDNDSEEFEPEFIYAEAGIYRVKLTVTDSFGYESEVINFVNVKEEDVDVIPVGSATADLKADFTTNPLVDSSDGAIHLSGDFDEVRFDFTDSEGDIAKYVFDNNTYIDSNDNGRKADDTDYKSTQPGVYTTTFNAETDRIKVRFTVYDEDGNFDIKEVRIVFDDDGDDALRDVDTNRTEGSMEANLLNATDQKYIPIAVVSIVVFAIVFLSAFMHFTRLKTVRVHKNSEDRTDK